MTETSTEDWDPERRLSAAAMLAKVLRGDPERAHAIAGGVSGYPAAFTDFGAFLVALDAGEPRALELALVIAAALDPESGVPAGRVLLPGGPRKPLGSALAKALACRTLWLPQEGADADMVDSDGRGDSLLAYLQRSMKWAGFPGFASIVGRPDDWLATARTARGPFQLHSG